MDEDQLNDLKQFIAVTVSQTEARLTERIERVEDRLETVEQRLERVEKKVDDGFAGVGDTFDQSSERQAEFDQRLIKLEQQTA